MFKRDRTAADVPVGRIVGMEPAPVYGMELVLDLHGCDHTRFTRERLEEFFNLLCFQLGMAKGPSHFWDYGGDAAAKAAAPPHLKGISAVQFIYTSNITIHTLDDLHRVYLNIFSCKEFNISQAIQFSETFFAAESCHHRCFQRS